MANSAAATATGRAGGLGVSPIVKPAEEIRALGPSRREILGRPLVPLGPDLLPGEELLHRQVQLPGRDPERLADGLHPLPRVRLDVVTELLGELDQLRRGALLAGGAFGCLLGAARR